MKKIPLFQGSCTAIVTPFGEKGIDYERLSRQHPGIVQNQAIAWPQKLGQIVKVGVLQLSAFLIQPQEPGPIPPLQRRLGDQLLRKIKIKIRSLHATFAPVS